MNTSNIKNHSSRSLNLPWHTGALVAFVGFSSSFAIVLRGLMAVGASQKEAASGLMLLCIIMGITAILLSLKTRQPISAAWSTSGAALLISTGSAPTGGFSAAVGAFIMAAAMVVVAGFWKRLLRLVMAIPTSLANAMLAGVLLNLCLAPVRAMDKSPLITLAVVLTWLIIGRIRKVYAVPAAVIVAMVIIGFHSPACPVRESFIPYPVFILPSFTMQAFIGISLPLFVVTMASQNIPGLAVLRLNGYRPDPGFLFKSTGLAGIIAALFGGHTINLAAITAALSASSEAHPDSKKRYQVSVIAGSLYIIIGLCVAAITVFIENSPPLLIETVAGLALLNTFGSAIAGSIENDAANSKHREAAIITFLVTASQLNFGGISGAFWGLIAGGIYLGVVQFKSRKPY